MDDLDKQGVTPHALAPHVQRQIGSEGLWTFVFIDMVIFTLIFFVFMSERLGDYALFQAGQSHLNANFGLLNTLVLLTSSYLVVEAVHSARAAQPDVVQRCLLMALLCGVLFVVSKIIEYYAKLVLGFTPATNPFFSFYFFITFVLLAIAAYKARLVVQHFMAVAHAPGHWRFLYETWVFVAAAIIVIGHYVTLMRVE